MKSILGKISVNSLLVQGDIWCVAGDRKWTLSVYTVRNIDIVTIIIVNNKYFPIRGITMDVGGLISDSSRKNTVRASRIEMDRVIFSPLSDGK